MNGLAIGRYVPGLLREQTRQRFGQAPIGDAGQVQWVVTQEHNQLMGDIVLRVFPTIVISVSFCVVCAPAFSDIGIAANERYFEDDGQPVVLFGNGLWTIITDTSVDIEDHNRWYADWGGNANRAALYSFFNAVPDGKGVGPWRRTGPGLGNDGELKFNLSVSNEAFWDRAHHYFESCERNGIYVWLQIFGEPYVEAGEQRWHYNPFNSDNNVNALPGMPGGQNSGEEAFYDPDNEAIMEIQDALVLRLLDETAERYGNIVYEIGNEINADSVSDKAAAWQQHWIDLFQAYARDHDVTLILSNDTRRSLFEAGAPGFQVVNHHAFTQLQVKGNASERMAQSIRTAVQKDFAEFQSPIVNSRPCSDPDRVNYGDIASEVEGRCLYWSYFMSGGHVISFRTTHESWKGGLKAERIIKHLRTFIDHIPYHQMSPNVDSVKGEALSLADSGGTHALYLPVGGAVSIDLSAAKGPFVARWYDPRTGKWADEVPLNSTGAVTLNAPDLQDWALLIRAR
jgi:hypothetical protein